MGDKWEQCTLFSNLLGAVCAARGSRELFPNEGHIPRAGSWGLFPNEGHISTSPELAPVGSFPPRAADAELSPPARLGQLPWMTPLIAYVEK